MIGPVLMKYGSPQQQERLLPRMLTVEDFWCQGYSEPGSGSDLASLRTRAVRRGDKYIVNGQKTWTTMAHHADWIFCLVRTDTEARQQQGISLLLIDMKSPGVSVRPIKTLDGGHEVNETWFEDVEVPVENIVARVGLVPDVGALHLLPRLIGLQRTRELAYSARELPAQEALALGLVLEVHPGEGLLARAQQIARALSDASPVAFAMTKQLLARTYELDRRSLLDAEANAQAVAFGTDYFGQAIDAFMRGDKAKFQWPGA